MNKKNVIMWLISLLASVVILIFISNLIFSGKNGINQGQFRVTDAILTSTARVEDVDKDKAKWEINISQNNRLSLLIKGMDGAKISRVEVEKMKILKKPKIGNIYISEPRTKEVMAFEDSKNENVAVYVDTKTDGSYFIEIEILNKEIVKNFILPEGTKEIRHDGTAIANAKKTINDITFKVSFSLNITAESGKLSKCNITLSLPEESLLTNGQVVTRLPLADFGFKN